MRPLNLRLAIALIDKSAQEDDYMKTKKWRAWTTPLGAVHVHHLGRGQNASY